jgi:hypothetical protein
MNRYILTSICLVVACRGYAQNIATTSLQWNATSVFEAHLGNTTVEPGTVTTANGHIVWKAANGSVKYDFTILETNGTWTNVSANGSVTYEVDHQNNRGTVQFKRDNGGVTIRIVLTTGSEPLIYELTIDTIETL